MYLCKFSQNPSIGSIDIASERSYADADADGIRTKNNMSPTFCWGDIIIYFYLFILFSPSDSPRAINKKILQLADCSIQVGNNMCYDYYSFVQGQVSLTATVTCNQYYLLSCGADGAR